MTRQHALTATGATCIALLSLSPAIAGSDLVAYPDGYQNAFTHYSTRNRDDERKQVVKLFANDVAVASAKDGAPLDSGSVIVMEVYKAKLDAEENPVKGADGYFVPAAMGGDRCDGGANRLGRGVSRSVAQPQLGVCAVQGRRSQPDRARLPALLRLP